MKENIKLRKIDEFWKEIRELSYSSAVWNYEDNKFRDIALKYGLYGKCCEKIYDKIDYNFCSNCGKRIEFKIKGLN